jgi:hypothetical protein
VPNTPHTKEHLDEDVTRFLEALEENRATYGERPEVQQWADFTSLAEIAWQRVGGGDALSEDRKVWRLLICRVAARRYTDDQLNMAS